MSITVPHDNQPQKSGFEEIRDLMTELPFADLEATTAVQSRLSALDIPQDGLGRLGELAIWLSTWQGERVPSLEHPRISVFAADNGVAAQENATGMALDETRTLVDKMVDGKALIHHLCEKADTDLRVYEMDLENSCADITESAAMGEEECARAMAYGMMAVEQGINVLCLSEVGAGSKLAASALCYALFGGEAGDWIADMPRAKAKRAAQIETIEKAVKLHTQDGCTDPLQLLARLGGPQFGAICGAILACRLARTPVILDGFTAMAAAAVLFKMNKTVLDHCQLAQISPNTMHQKLMNKLGKRWHPICDQQVHMREGIASALSLPILRTALELTGASLQSAK